MSSAASSRLEDELGVVLFSTHDAFRLADPGRAGAAAARPRPTAELDQGSSNSPCEPTKEARPRGRWRHRPEGAVRHEPGAASHHRGLRSILADLRNDEPLLVRGRLRALGARLPARRGAQRRMVTRRTADGVAEPRNCTSASALSERSRASIERPALLGVSRRVARPPRLTE